MKRWQIRITFREEESFESVLKLIEALTALLDWAKAEVGINWKLIEHDNKEE